MLLVAVNSYTLQLHQFMEMFGALKMEKILDLLSIPFWYHNLLIDYIIMLCQRTPGRNWK